MQNMIIHEANKFAKSHYKTGERETILLATTVLWVDELEASSTCPEQLPTFLPHNEPKQHPPPPCTSPPPDLFYHPFNSLSAISISILSTLCCRLQVADSFSITAPRNCVMYSCSPISCSKAHSLLIDSTLSWVHLLLLFIANIFWHLRSWQAMTLPNPPSPRTSSSDWM